VKKYSFFIFIAGLSFFLFNAQNFDKLNPVEKNNITIFKSNAGAVVNVQNNQVAHSWWDEKAVEVPAGAGSGFVWDNQGHIVTNFHVVANGSSFVVTFDDSKQYKAEIVGVEPKKDIAVLKILDKKDRPLNPINVGSSKELQVGQQAIAIGSPFGLDRTMTSGIISATGRSVLGIGGVTIREMIQTDAAINPGNSGGPLLNSSGELIGMNTLIFSGSGTSAGVGFAVPVDTIKQIVPQLIQHGKVIRPGLGISTLPEEYRDRLGLTKGVAITSIEKNGPAAKAGLQGMGRDVLGRVYLGDIILEINGQEVNSFDDLYNVLEKYKIGDNVTVTYLRGDKKKQVKLILAQI
jgi:S1-C subfamily serine protease